MSKNFGLGFRLTIATPATLLVEGEGVVSIRAEDQSGGFGLLPGCADFLTVLPACVVRWRMATGGERYCALRGGVLTATGGGRVAIACREGVLGGDLRKLEAEARAARAAQADAAARARVEQTRLHAGAVRQLIRYLRPAGLTESLFADGEGDAS
jgi:F-type H+-transporting ATPase subunit epsilon